MGMEIPSLCLMLQDYVVVARYCHKRQINSLSGLSLNRYTKSTNAVHRILIQAGYRFIPGFINCKAK